MKSPEKMPPASSVFANGNSGANAPTVNVQQHAAAYTTLVSTANAPQFAPPEIEEGVTAAEAAVWNSDKRVNALYTTLHARNSWMSIAGVGWKKLTTANDSACEAMTQLVSHCREKNCRIDFSEENGTVTEMYIW